MLKRQRLQQADAAAKARAVARERQALKEQKASDVPVVEVQPVVVETKSAPKPVAPIVLETSDEPVLETFRFAPLDPVEVPVAKVQTPVAPVVAVVPTPATIKVTVQEGQLGDEVEQELKRQKEEAMEKAFAMHVGQLESPANQSRRHQELGVMMFCTHCRTTTPGEYVESGHENLEGIWKVLSFIPGASYFVVRKLGEPDHCTHCHSQELIPMHSAQARALCGDEYEARMQHGWGEMRSAAREHTQERRFAIGKILVVCMCVLGASLYFMRS